MTIFRLHRNKDAVKPLPFGVYAWSVAGLAAAALANTIYLSISHFRVYTDFGYKSFCAISKAINCDTVSQSPYSILLNVPVPIWGILGFLLILVLLPFARSPQAEKKRIWALLLLIGFAYSAYSLVLAGISALLIHSYCIMCLLSYALTFALLYFIWLIRRRFDSAGFFTALRADLIYLRSKKLKVTAAISPFAASALVLILFMPTYWEFSPPQLSNTLQHGTTPDGHPWIGSEEAEIVIVEYADYLCFQCKKAQYFLRNLMLSHPGKIKLIHRHFPMDHTVNPLVKVPFHVGSGALALMAIHAHKNDKFWQLNDYFYNNSGELGKINVEGLALSFGLDAGEMKRALADKYIHQKLRRDIIDGLKLGVKGTPSFVIGGKLYTGQIPARVLSKVLDASSK